MAVLTLARISDYHFENVTKYHMIWTVKHSLDPSCSQTLKAFTVARRPSWQFNILCADLKSQAAIGTGSELLGLI